MRIAYKTMVQQFARVLQKKGFGPEDAAEAAEIFAQNSLSGVYSHGLNRFPRTVRYLDCGHIDPSAKATCEQSAGALERWNGHRGFGPLNARRAMQRACELAKEYGIGCVALGNNHHWMRGGTYGWQAAEQGLIGICWSNTMPNLPAWGARDHRLGNNPIVFAVPRAGGDHLLLDCAISQFSYGKLQSAALAGQQLPVPGGYDAQGQPTTDPVALQQTRRVFPIGYWKGSGLSVALDLICTLLSGGNSVCKIGTFGEEVGLNQVFIAADPARFQSQEQTEAIVEEILADLKRSEPETEGGEVCYPGERMARTRRENLEQGIPVVEEIWNSVLAM